MNPDEAIEGPGSPQSRQPRASDRPGRERNVRRGVYGVRVTNRTDETADRVRRFRTGAAERGLPPDAAERWVRSLRPAAYLADGGDGPVAARLGGRPRLPYGAPEPSHGFVAAVDCALLRADATDLPLPADGHLLFFAVPGIDFTGRREDVVRYVPAGTATAEPPAGDGGELFPGRELRTTVYAPSTQDSGSFTRAQYGDPPPQDEYTRTYRLSDVWGASGADGFDWSLQLGGHPMVPNIDPLEGLRGHDPDEEGSGHTRTGGRDDWTLLATWRCGEDAPDEAGLDGLVVHWLVLRRDLAALRLDRVLTFVDMWAS